MIQAIGAETRRKVARRGSPAFPLIAGRDCRRTMGERRGFPPSVASIPGPDAGMRYSLEGSGGEGIVPRPVFTPLDFSA